VNYIHHALIGIGTASLGIVAAESFGAPAMPATTLAAAAVIVAAGSIATDLDHPRSFISHSIPSRVARIALTVLTLPLLVALGILLTSSDVQGAWDLFTAWVFGVTFLRWALIILLLSLALMGLSWLLYKSLHHRGPLHSLVFTLGVALIACLAFWYFNADWRLGLWFGWGWLWHLLADGLTEAGVPYFWPWKPDHKRLLPVWMLAIGRWLLSMVALAGVIILFVLRLQIWSI
jgi:membrane-bound metal-dependent hydrolase YbcI (DUF457 family)